ncbi:MAG TPA: hypothetical protein VFV98_03955 [Vicinamibacterales bacterium]|nr:hypothetical protein [Vicinamibacterales bacterium]
MRALLMVVVALSLIRPQANVAPSADIESLIKQALEDRLAANDIPDGILVGRTKRIPILETMPRTGTRLTSRALPQREGAEFYLLSSKDAQAEADRTARDVPYIFVDQPSIDGEIGSLAIGVDFVMPRDKKVAKSCCCTGVGQFKRVAGTWTFLKWVRMICP